MKLKLSGRQLLLRFLFLSLVLVLVAFVLGTWSFRKITLPARHGMKHNFDQLIFEALKSQPENAKKEFLQKLDKNFLLLESHYWIIDNENHVTASSSSLPVPQLPVDWVSVVQNPQRLNYAVTTKNRSQLVAIQAFPNSDLYLVSQHDMTIGPLRQFRLPYLTLIFSCVALAIFVGTLIMLAYLRGRAKKIIAVFRRIQEGDLQARIIESEFDEIGLLTSEFNHTANYMAELIEKLKLLEAGRYALLKELCHDLRSPIGALRSLIENLRDYRAKMSEEQLAQMVSLAEREVGSIQSLSEDLLFLAQMKDAKYRPALEKLSLLYLLENEAVLFQTQLQQSKSNLQLIFKNQGLTAETAIEGDSDLLLRAIRNLLENSIKFANSQILLQCQISKDQIVITISDDGPGFPKEYLGNFETWTNHHGLGLLIVHQVIKLHSGRIIFRNIIENKQVRGASCEIIF